MHRECFCTLSALVGEIIGITTVNEIVNDANPWGSLPFFQPTIPSRKALGSS